MYRYQWLEDLHRMHYDTLIRLARARLRQSAASVHDAEDVVQQAFLLAAEKGIRDHEAPVKWLMKTVSNLCMNRATSALRTKQKQQRVIRQRLDNSPVRSVYAVEMTTGEMDEREMLMLIEQTLTPEEAELLMQYCTGDLSIDDLAAQKGVKPVALRVQIHRIRKKLKKEFYGL